MGPELAIVYFICGLFGVINALPVKNSSVEYSDEASSEWMGNATYGFPMRSECEPVAKCWTEISDLGSKCNTLYVTSSALYSCYHNGQLVNTVECEALFNSYPELLEMIECEKEYTKGVRQFDRDMCIVHKKYGECMGDRMANIVDCDEENFGNFDATAPRAHTLTPPVQPVLQAPPVVAPLAIPVAETAMAGIVGAQIRARRAAVIAKAEFHERVIRNTGATVPKQASSSLDPCARSIVDQSKLCNRLDREHECTHTEDEWALYDRCESAYQKSMKEISERQVEVLKSLSEVYHKCHKEAEGRLWNRIRENIPAAVVKTDSKPGTQSHSTTPGFNAQKLNRESTTPGFNAQKVNRENPVVLMNQDEILEP